MGNPGREYALTRHNIGFEAIDYLAGQKNVLMNKDEQNGLTGFYFENGEKIMLVKPMTYMNNSGLCVAGLVNYYAVPPEKTLVIYDDIDLDLGKIRIRKKGSAGTHNGMRSIIEHLKEQNFSRIRIGIGKKPPHWDLANYVLSKFTPDETQIMREAIIKASEAVELFIKEDINVAMNRLNRKAKETVEEIETKC
ncbi:MAG: aminoacyl-tRNA hydrolase [Eubacterium sp.]